jgi:hypothetical protein
VLRADGGSHRLQEALPFRLGQHQHGKARPHAPGLSWRRKFAESG